MRIAKIRCSALDSLSSGGQELPSHGTSGVLAVQAGLFGDVMNWCSVRIIVRKRSPIRFELGEASAGQAAEQVDRTVRPLEVATGV
jgi:hypothetical protein